MLLGVAHAPRSRGEAIGIKRTIEEEKNSVLPANRNCTFLFIRPVDLTGLALQYLETHDSFTAAMSDMSPLSYYILTLQRTRDHSD